ncbi:MAG TPA: lysylphosphatidylglycerol synthase transmembrane domain-containing protein [Ktedonobacterales bacterium]
MPPWLRGLLSPRVLIPTIMVAGTLALLFSIGNPKRILALIGGFSAIDLLWVFLLTVVYELVRFVQWWYLLKHEGVKVSLAAQVFSFAGGEATRFAPIGNYFQNYLLTTAEGTDFGYSSAATTLIIVFEVAVCITGLVLLGLGDWWWLRPLIVTGVIVGAGAGWLVYRYHGTLDAPAWVRTHRRVYDTWDKAAGELRQFGTGAKRILQWHTLAVSYVLAACYLLAAGGILYVILGGLGWNKSPFGVVLAVYFFSLAVGLIFPLPFDLGVTELSGVGAFLVAGVERDTAISAMLINRALTLAFSLLIAAVVSVVLRDELRKALQARGIQRKKPPDQEKQAVSDEERRREPVHDKTQEQAAIQQPGDVQSFESRSGALELPLTASYQANPASDLTDLKDQAHGAATP